MADESLGRARRAPGRPGENTPWRDESTSGSPAHTAATSPCLCHCDATIRNAKFDIRIRRKNRRFHGDFDKPARTALETVQRGGADDTHCVCVVANASAHGGGGNTTFSSGPAPRANHSTARRRDGTARWRLRAHDDTPQTSPAPRRDSQTREIRRLNFAQNTTVSWRFRQSRPDRSGNDLERRRRWCAPRVCRGERVGAAERRRHDGFVGGSHEAGRGTIPDGALGRPRRIVAHTISQLAFQEPTDERDLATDRTGQTRPVRRRARRPWKLPRQWKRLPAAHNRQRDHLSLTREHDGERDGTNGRASATRCRRRHRRDGATRIHAYGASRFRPRCGPEKTRSEGTPLPLPARRIPSNETGKRGHAARVRADNAPIAGAELPAKGTRGGNVSASTSTTASRKASRSEGEGPVRTSDALLVRWPRMREAGPRTRPTRPRDRLTILVAEGHDDGAASR